MDLPTIKHSGNQSGYEIHSNSTGNFGRELVVSHTILSMFGKVFGVCLELSMWRLEERAFYIGLVRLAKFILAWQEMLK